MLLQFTTARIVTFSTTACYYNLRRVCYYNSRHLLLHFTTGITIHDKCNYNSRQVLQFTTLLHFMTEHTDPTRAAHQRTAMYIKVICFVNIVAYLFDFTMLKYRLSAINPIVWRETSPNVRDPKPRNRQNLSPNDHWPWKRVATDKCIEQVDIRISLTPSASTNMLGSVRSLLFLLR